MNQPPASIQRFTIAISCGWQPDMLIFHSPLDHVHAPWRPSGVWNLDRHVYPAADSCMGLWVEFLEPAGLRSLSFHDEIPTTDLFRATHSASQRTSTLDS